MLHNVKKQKSKNEKKKERKKERKKEKKTKYEKMNTEQICPKRQNDKYTSNNELILFHFHT